MNILLTNDDGVNARGINALYNALKDNYNVYIFAPDGERSACSNAITVRQELITTKIDTNIFSLSGFTADCINVALHSDFVPAIDLVISGINHGQNVADDIIYSGTVAGARTAFVNGITAIAVSINSYHNISEYFDDAAAFIGAFISKHKKQLVSRPYFYNINYPDLPPERIGKTVFTSIGKKYYYDNYTLDTISKSQYRLNLDGKFSQVEEEGTDVTELTNGNISITPLTQQCTDFDQLENLQQQSIVYETK